MDERLAMPSRKQKTNEVSTAEKVSALPANRPVGVSTENVQTLYVNLASVVSGFFDFRIYLMEAGPAEVATVSPLPDVRAAFSPKICVVVSPEFARSLRDTLSSTLERFEAQNGKLRPVPPNPSRTVRHGH